MKPARCSARRHRGLEALAAGQFDGGGGDVVLRIDELLLRAVGFSMGTWNSATDASSGALDAGRLPAAVL